MAGRLFDKQGERGARWLCEVARTLISFEINYVQTLPYQLRLFYCALLTESL